MTIEGPVFTYQLPAAALTYRIRDVSNTGSPDEDALIVQFTDDVSGTIDLASGGNESFATCTTCVRMIQDFEQTFSEDTQFFQSQGTLTVSEPAFSEEATLSFEGVRLVEVESVDGVTTPVVDGACLDIVDATPLTIPQSWTCGFTTYQDNTTCDCGCGEPDPDCADLTVDSCDECNAPGSCAEEGFGCGEIDAVDHTTCVP